MYENDGRLKCSRVAGYEQGMRINFSINQSPLRKLIFFLRVIDQSKTYITLCTEISEI